MPDNVIQLPGLAGVDPQRHLSETSTERFDRAAFAREVLALARPRHTTVAICEGSSTLRLQSGRMWRRRPGQTNDEACLDERWALLAVPPHASRRAIVLAVAELARAPRPYVLDLLVYLGAPVGAGLG